MAVDSQNLDPERKPLLLSAADLAKELGLSRRTVSRLDSSGKLPRPLRLGGSVRWRSDEIARWIDEGCPDRQAMSKQRKGA